jgi:hypothetical protein
MFGLLAAIAFTAGVIVFFGPRFRAGQTAMAPAGGHGEPPGRA